MNKLYEAIIEDTRISPGVIEVIKDIKTKLDAEKAPKKPIDKKPTRKITAAEKVTAKTGFKVLEVVEGVEWIVSPSTGKWIKLGSRTPYTHIPKFWYAFFLTVMYIVAMAFVANDYKGI